jgi:hypothetical protein
LAKLSRFPKSAVSIIGTSAGLPESYRDDMLFGVLTPAQTPTTPSGVLAPNTHVHLIAIARVTIRDEKAAFRVF